MSTTSVPPPSYDNPPPPEESGNGIRRLRRWAAWVGLATAIVILFSATVAAFTDGGFGKLWNRLHDLPAATIISPADIAVPHVVPLFGTYQDLPEDNLIWAVSRDMTTNMIYPQDKPCALDGDQFNCGNYYLGSDTGNGEKIAIVIVAADADAVNTFSRYQATKGGPKGANPGLEQLPSGAAVIGSKIVVRNQ